MAGQHDRRMQGKQHIPALIGSFYTDINGIFGQAGSVCPGLRLDKAYIVAVFRVYDPIGFKQQRLKNT